MTSLKSIIINQSIHSLTDDEKLKLTKEFYLSMSDNYKSKFVKWPIVGFEFEDFDRYESSKDKCHRCHVEDEITYDVVCWAMTKNVKSYKIRSYCKSCLRYFINCVTELNCYKMYGNCPIAGCKFIAGGEDDDWDVIEFYNCSNKEHKHLLRQIFSPLQ